MMWIFIGSNRNHSPTLIPYPNYDMNRLPNRRQRATDRIVNTFRLSVDECNRLWVIDVGVANGTTYGDPQLFIFDLRTDRVIRQFSIGTNLRRGDGSTWFPGLVADVDPNSCDRAFAYLPDIGWGLVVYSFHNNTAWRLEHHYFYFDPLSTIFNINGIRLEWTDGLFGLTLSERHSDGYRTLYFQALASTRMFSVNTRVLQSNRSITDSFNEYRHHGYRQSSLQAASMSMDPITGAMFYALVNHDAIGCWNPRRFERHTNDTTTVVAQDSVTLQFPADVKVDFQSNLWVLSDRMPLYRFRVHDFNVNDVNYRVFSAPVADVIRGTACELSSSDTGNQNNNGEFNNNNNSSRRTTTVRPSRPTTGQPTSNNGGWNFPNTNL